MSESSPAKKVPAKKAPRHAPPDPEVTAHVPMPTLGDGIWYEPVWLYRFLMEDGDVVDVEAIHDDSRLREAILKSRGKKVDRIAGSTRVRCLGYPDMKKLL